MKKSIFLGIWLATGVLPYLFDKASLPIYYYGIGSSVALLVGFAVVVKKAKVAGYILLVLAVVSNVGLIRQINPTGTIPEINVQDKMLLTDEKQVVDFVYHKAAGRPFAVNALSNPYKVNTTWSYLFEWYGLAKYHYLPVWGGDAAMGFEGKLTIETARSKLPKDYFLIIEPQRGINPELAIKFLAEEDIFTKVTAEDKFGRFMVQSRK